VVEIGILMPSGKTMEGFLSVGDDNVLEFILLVLFMRCGFVTNRSEI